MSPIDCHAGDCSIYMPYSNICDCGHLRHRATSQNATADELFAWAKHIKALDQASILLNAGVVVLEVGGVPGGE